MNIEPACLSSLQRLERSLPVAHRKAARGRVELRASSGGMLGTSRPDRAESMRQSTPASARKGPSLCTASLLAVLALTAASNAAAQGRPDAPATAAPNVAPAARPPEDLNRPATIERTIQHGFFGDLSRPAPPAINRVDGIRIPSAAQRPETKPATPEASSAPQRTEARSKDTAPSEQADNSHAPPLERAAEARSEPDRETRKPQ